MQPIAIAFKDYAVNPFTNRGGGELMVIHMCLRCGKLSANRIAGDDSEYQIINILNDGLTLDETTTAKFRNLSLEPITASNKKEALASLLGH